VVATWGVVGTLGLIAEAVARLGLVVWDAISSGSMTTAAWVAAGLWVTANVYLEGYRGFHLRFAPRAVARALRLGREGSALSMFLAPLVCAGLIHATRRRLVASWGLVGGIVALVVMVRGLVQPWRAVVDAGVVVALVVGSASLVVMLVRGLRGELEGVATDFPGDPKLVDTRGRAELLPTGEAVAS
jgi:hypothetical protein